MSSDLAWSNVLAYSLQIGLLVALAAAVPAFLRMRLPKVRLLYWQALLAACILLPQTRPWQQTMITLTVTQPGPSKPLIQAVKPITQASHAWTPAEIALWILAAGAMVRLVWLAAGFWKLRRYRDHSVPWYGETAHLGARRPEFRICDRVASPVTFGIAQPVVLLPKNFPSLGHSLQEAILMHETVHVERRDWAYTVAEEVVRAILWFHPAIWWLLSEIQLAREQSVDREVVDRTQARDAYVDALLAVAGARLETDLALAPLFLRKRHLKQRVMTIVKETGMSKLRAVAAMAAGLSMLAAAGWFVTAVFPLAAEPQTVMDAAGVTVDLQGAQLMHRPSVSYPIEAARKSVQGTVTVQVKLAADGNVSDANVVSGPDELRKQVLQSVLEWHFSPSLGGTTRQVSINFQLPAAAVAPTVVAPTPAPKRIAFGATEPFVLKHILTPNLSDEARAELLAKLPVREGDTVTMETMRQAMTAVREFDSHLSTGLRGDAATGDRELVILAPGVTGTVGQSFSTGGVTAPPPAIPQTSSNGGTPPRRVVIGGNVQAAMLTYGPMPEYPPLARQARVQGTVQLHAFIAPDGSIETLTVIPPAHALLAPAALEAVKTWRYKPTLLNGEAVGVETTIEVTFSLSN